MKSKSDTAKIFDQPNALSMVKARQNFLGGFLPELQKPLGLKTALDVGCGVGYFSRYLKDLGLEVRSVDIREDNIGEARKRNPDIPFLIGDVEDPSFPALGSCDLVLCFGLLYHLENPFRAIRNLSVVTDKVLILETRVAPLRRPGTILYEESQGEDQGIRFMALIPSESGFVKMLYKAGFRYVYRIAPQPDHEEFRGSMLLKRMRTILIAAKVELRLPMLRRTLEPRWTNRHAWWRFGLGYLLEYVKRGK